MDAAAAGENEEVSVSGTTRESGGLTWLLGICQQYHSRRPVHSDFDCAATGFRQSTGGRQRARHRHFPNNAYIPVVAPRLGKEPRRVPRTLWIGRVSAEGFGAVGCGCMVIGGLNQRTKQLRYLGAERQVK